MSYRFRRSLLLISARLVTHFGIKDFSRVSAVFRRSGASKTLFRRSFNLSIFRLFSRKQEIVASILLNLLGLAASDGKKRERMTDTRTEYAIAQGYSETPTQAKRRFKRAIKSLRRMLDVIESHAEQGNLDPLQLESIPEYAEEIVEHAKCCIWENITDHSAFIEYLKCDRKLKPAKAMKKIRLTSVQENGLLHLYDQPVTDIHCQMFISRTIQTMTSLCDRGLARWYPYGAGGQGCWKITSQGKRYVEEYLTEEVS